MNSSTDFFYFFKKAQLEIDPWAFHLTLGYLLNENTLEEEQNLWYVSIAVANLGVESNTDKNSPAPIPLLSWQGWSMRCPKSLILISGSNTGSTILKPTGSCWPGRPGSFSRFCQTKRGNLKFQEAPFCLNEN